MVINSNLIYTLGVLAALWAAARYERRTQSSAAPAVAAPPPALKPLCDHPQRWVIRFAVIAVVLGVFVRWFGTDRSLGLDEFCTLWVVEAGFGEVARRTLEFQGQSPFYYWLVWPFVHGLGETEFLLRLPSLLSGLATLGVIYRLGWLLGGHTTGLPAASFACLSFPLVEASALARPYALAALMGALMLWGFVEAALRARGWGRLLFVIAGAGLFSAHYALSLMSLGIAGAYLLQPPLRRRYPFPQFGADVAMQLLVATLWGPHLLALWGRRSELDWIPQPDYAVFLDLIGPFLVFAVAERVAGTHRPAPGSQGSLQTLLWLAMAAQVTLLTLLVAAGVNLLHRRYMIVIVVPAVVLAAHGLRKLPKRLAVLPWSYWIALTLGMLGGHFYFAGTFSAVGYQDWRAAVDLLEARIQEEPEAPVLFRAGLVEEDGHPRKQISAAVLAPLRSPARNRPTWNLVPLTYRWAAPGREAYFRKAVVPKIEAARSFYFLTCYYYNEGTGHYHELLHDWVQERFPGRFSADYMESPQGTVLIRFERR